MVDFGEAKRSLGRLQVEYGVQFIGEVLTDKIAEAVIARLDSDAEIGHIESGIEAFSKLGGKHA